MPYSGVRLSLENCLATFLSKVKVYIIKREIAIPTKNKAAMNELAIMSKIRGMINKI